MRRRQEDVSTGPRRTGDADQAGDLPAGTERDADSGRGEPARYDPRTGEVTGSGASAGGGNPDEDYDHDIAGGDAVKRHGGARDRAVGGGAKDRFQGDAV